ncbi:MAG: hypothetical protein KKF77_03600 [Proteobacteria bacterium]|nr:hypothetical protein [Pseudomonadota bacterium]
MTSPYINVDLYCGGGGASEGFRMATGRDPDVAVNHDPKAIAMHQANHPGTLHICQDMWTCPPRWATIGFIVALAAQPFWICATWRARPRQWGMFAMACWYTLVWGYGAWTQWGSSW